MQNKKNEARKLISKPHGGRQKCVCEMWASKHTNTSTWSLYVDSSWNKHEIVYPRISNNVTCCLLSKGIFLLDILRFEVCKQPDPLRTKDLK